tara:strand:+ start:1915 stop:2754 length:840 start_codon:yes stop_codon:yes gene_type:complete
MLRESKTYTSGCKKLLSLLLLIIASPAFSHSHSHPHAHSQEQVQEQEQAQENTPTEAPISLYRASYTAQFSGLNINAVQKLEEIEPGIYRESLTAKNFIGQVNEQTTFRVSADQQLFPIQYSYDRSVFGKDRSEVQSYDWENRTVAYKKDGKTNSELALEAGYLDMITHRLQLRRDLNSGKQIFSYPVISRGKLKQYDYKVVSEQILQTTIGPLNTVKVERVIKEGDKTVNVWLATDWDYLVVKLEQSKDKDGHHLELRSATINNITITPLAKTDEKQL